MDLLQKVSDYISRHRMVERGDKVLVAVSGGPDSTALLHILYQLKDDLGISLHVAHLNHMFRGEESEKDAFFVAETAQRYGLPATVESVDVPSYRARRRLSNQVAAREVRFKFLLECAGRVGASRIALAHQADDQAETILFNFLRGTGTGGLKGILPVRDGIYIRPLLNVRRSEIESYCSEMDLAFRHDSSNLKPVYTRNRIRLNLVPLLEKEYNPELVPALMRLGEICREEDSYLDHLAEKALQEALLKSDTGLVSLSLDRLVESPLAVRRRVLRRAWQVVSGGAGHLDFQHAEAALDLVSSGATGAQAVMPGNVFAVRTYTALELKRAPLKKALPGYIYELRVPGATYIPEIGATVCAELSSGESERNPRSLPGSEALLDFDKLPPVVYVRRRLAGDVFHPYGQVSEIKLKDFLIKQKIPREERERLPLVCTPKEIIWVGGIRTGEKWKVSDSTRKMLHLKLIPGDLAFDCNRY
ncbi:tRNA lysidine(34) synthetase TilS [Pelotomaculum propionicicum]|uniref:tRNA lysidine(34) synthetase TilS n=1 Tax=Pelotomaculum propionicicum TaxID=258475 RepID=UPI003B7B7DCB